MKKIVYILIAFSFFACKNEKKTVTPKPVQEEITATTAQTDSIAAEEEEKLPILTGIQTLKTISSAPYDSWFTPNYKAYEGMVDMKILEKTPSLKDINIKIFMGTWCEDSQLQVPQFFQVLETAELFLKDGSTKNYEIITVDEDKMTPEHLEDGYDITNVPTFIFYRDGKEINRIVESPVVSLEADLLQILTGKPYKHTYAE